MQLRGVAASRGERWADHVALVVPRSQSWPDGSDKILTIARRKVEDLGRDEKLIDMLAAEVVRAAARRWNGQRHTLRQNALD